MLRNTLITVSLVLTAACGTNAPTSKVMVSVSCPIALATVYTTNADGSVESTTTMGVKEYSADFYEDGSVDASMELETGNKTAADHKDRAELVSVIQINDDHGNTITVTTDAAARTVELEIVTSTSSQTNDVTSQCTFN